MGKISPPPIPGRFRWGSGEIWMPAAFSSVDADPSA